MAIPHLVLGRIAYFLTDDLTTLLSLASVNATLRRICRLYISDSFHTISRGDLPPLSKDYLYHDLLWMILNGFLDPKAITDFMFYEQWEVKPSKTSEPGYFVGKSTELEKQSFFTLIEETVQASPWIPGDKNQEVCSGFREGSRDAAVAILLPLCPRLKSIDAPIVGMPLCATVFRKITEEYQRRVSDPTQAREEALDAARRDLNGPRARGEDPQLPFSELLILSTQAAEYDLGPRLPECIPFMGIPSLQRIILRGLRERELPKDFPGWPSESPRPSAPEIYFQQSSVSREAVHAFAGGLRGPCEIRQWFEAPAECWGGGFYPEHADWDRVQIDARGNIEMKFDLQGGNPGYEHAWVSWLYWEKMRDWKRIDEEFASEDDDPEVPELDWNFGRY